jgi:stearoyl-CoA desaturase (delta-9 desaturase)
VLDAGEVAARDYSNVKDLSRFPELCWLERHKWIPQFIYGAVCFAIAGTPGIIWGFVISTVVLFHCTLAINSLGHTWGSRRYCTPDESRNNGVLALLTLGEGWHNNHHHYMSSARQGFFWWEIDVSYYVLRVLALAGIVSGLRLPDAAALTQPKSSAR